jgi:hypothetical protein
MPVVPRWPVPRIGRRHGKQAGGRARRTGPARSVPCVAPGGEESLRDICPAFAPVRRRGRLVRLWSSHGRARRGGPTTREGPPCHDPVAGFGRDHRPRPLDPARGCLIDGRTRGDGGRRERPRERRGVRVAGTVGAVSPERSEGSVGTGECSSSPYCRSTGRGVTAHGHRRHGQMAGGLYAQSGQGGCSPGEIAAAAGRPAASGAGPPSGPLTRQRAALNP